MTGLRILSMTPADLLAFPREKSLHYVIVGERRPGLAETLRQRLGFDGFEFAATATAHAARDLAKARRADLLVTESALLDESAYALCRSLTLDPLTCHMPLLMVAERGEVVDVEQAFAAGVTEFLQKPFSPDDLAARVRELAGAGAPSISVSTGHVRWPVPGDLRPRGDAGLR